MRISDWSSDVCSSDLGCAQLLKQHWPNLKVYAVEPVSSPVISGGQPGPHPIQGLGAGFIPRNLHTELLDGVITVDAPESKVMALRSASEEGMLVGISSRSEEHTSELQSLMRISYAVFCLTKKKKLTKYNTI